MTDEHPSEPGRLDLRPLGLDVGSAREDAIIAGTLRRLSPRDDVTPLLTLRRRVLYAAAAIVLTAGLSLVLSGTRHGALDAESQLIGWANSGYIPTNAELLAVYEGYQP